ncbi:adenylate and guanylate cyclase-like protein [Dermatophagoides farinae]|uniref:guanylate cyclase n=1 Tax=Dermatophagoides farinae TaxID=6954 RepID=A0A9D4P6B3_DERFA|nr:adenylate and guanylate cyclase-like protein [Dermatophagoides farinae]
MLCPMMMTGNYSWTENTLQSSSSTGLQQQQPPPPPMTPSHDTLIRMDTPNDEDKIDLKHISMALMKLLYPKAYDILEIIRKNFQNRNKDVWEDICKNFAAKCSTTSTKSYPFNKDSSNGSIQNIGKEKCPNINNNTDCGNENDKYDWFLDAKPDTITYDHLENFTKYLVKKLGLNWEEVIVDMGEKYARQCLATDSKPLNFIGENLIEFLVNIENIQSIAYKEVSHMTDFSNRAWTPSQPDLLPITVFVNNPETKIVVTYNIMEPICHFVACFLSGLYQRVARSLFNIVIRVNVEIGSDQYKFFIENRQSGATLVNDDSFVSRYKSYLLNRPEQLLMYIQTFKRVFPFHFVCDQNLRFIQYGTGLSKIFGAQNKHNVHISNVFNIVQPNVGFFFESIRHRINLAFILRIRDNISNEHFRRMELQGQIIECVETKCLLFLGSPIVKGLQSLTSRGLFLSDIPIHDATRDIILIEEQSRAQESLKRRMDKLKDTIQKANQAVEIERSKNVALLNLIFPAQVARRLWLGKSVEARHYDDVTMLFSDIVGFTAICSTATPMAIINMLNELYTQFDVFCGEIDVYKTETIGDAYCVASGLHRQTSHHAVLAAFMALKMMEAVKNFTPKDINVEKFQMRIGLHSGSCLSGIVGVRMPRYCLFGAHVTLANKFESQSQAQRINISPTTYRLLQKFPKFEFTLRDPNCLPKECPANLERKSAFVDSYHHPKLTANLSQTKHISRALEDINSIHNDNNQSGD